MVKVGILAAAPVAELKDLAAHTSKAYERALAASGLPPEHFRLRLMLRGMLPPLDPLHIGNATEKRPIAVLRAHSQESHAGLRDPRD